jgi:parallel beta-helix repeat protein
VTISDSIITKNTASPGSGGGICINGKLATISYNNIDENSAKYGGGIHASGNTVIITNNSINNNSAEGDGAGIYTDSCKAIIYNLITCNSISGDEGKAGGIYVTEQPSINYNNIYDNAPYDIYNSNACNSSAVNATNNWWGSTDETRIQAHIYDWYDTSSLGIINYIPYLTSKSSNVKRYNKGFVGNASPMIWYVDDGGGADFTEIEEAITAASDGDTIIVKDGNYIENVNVTKSLTIRSENGPDSTRVRSRVQSEPIFNVIADCVEISGFMMEYASDGVHLECVDYSDISNNKFYQCTNGIALYDSDNNCISNNNCSNVLEKGIYHSNSNYNSMSNNTCSNNDYGIYLTDQSNHNGISNNTCSNTFWTSISINGNNNRVFKNCFNNSRTAIDLGGSSNSITNNTCFNSRGNGIDISGSSNSITNNTCFNNEGDGIYIGTNSNNNNISYNICSNNSYGININGKKSKGSFGYYTISSSNNSISYNNCCSNRVGGICLSYSTHNRIFCNNNSNIGHISYSKWICGDGINIIGSDYTSISNNTCSNTDKGITLSGSDTGISNNTCSNNTYGIYIYSSCRGFSICYNNFLNNRRIGIFVGDGSGDDRFIYLNNFINNTENVESCDESATFNTPVKIIYTHNGKQYANYLGNYWDDYKGKDVDVDGIGNTPYHIENGKDDIYPLMEPWENYFKELFCSGALTPTPNLILTGDNLRMNVKHQHH